MRDCWPAPMPMIAPRYAYATLFDWVYFSARVATMRSVSAWLGSYNSINSDSSVDCCTTYLLILRDDVLEQLGVDLGIVALLLHMDAVHLASLDLGRLVVRVHLQNAVLAALLLAEDVECLL